MNCYMYCDIAKKKELISFSFAYSYLQLYFIVITRAVYIRSMYVCMYELHMNITLKMKMSFVHAFLSSHFFLLLRAR